jgi:hypothetical protein
MSEGKDVANEEVYGWSTNDLLNENLVSLPPIPLIFRDIAHLQEVYLPYLLDDFRASLLQELKKREHKTHRIEFDGENCVVVFSDELNIDAIDSFRNSVCLLSGDRFEKVLVVLKFPETLRDEIVRPVRFSFALDRLYPTGTFDELRLLGSLTPTQRAYNKLRYLSPDSCPDFIDDLLSGIYLKVCF